MEGVIADLQWIAEQKTDEESSKRYDIERRVLTFDQPRWAGSRSRSSTTPWPDRGCEIEQELKQLVPQAFTADSNALRPANQSAVVREAVTELATH